VGLHLGKTCFELYGYGWKSPSHLDLGLSIPLRDLIQVVNPYAVKKGEDLVCSRLTTDGLLSHNFIRSNFDACAALGNFRSVLGKEGDILLAYPPDFRPDSIRDVTVQEVLP